MKFAGNLAQDGDANTTTFFIIEETKEIKPDFPNGTIKSFVILFCFNIISM